MKKLFFILSLFFIAPYTHAALFLGKWEKNYRQVRDSLKRRKMPLCAIKPHKLKISHRRLIEDYKKRNASFEEKQWHAEYYARMRHDEY